MKNLFLLTFFLFSISLVNGQPTFSKNVIDGSYGMHMLSKLVDIDSDGDTDIITSEYDRLVLLVQVFQIFGYINVPLHTK